MSACPEDLANVDERHINLLLQHNHDQMLIENLKCQLSRRWRLRVIYVLLGLLWALTWPLLGWWLG